MSATLALALGPGALACGLGLLGALLLGAALPVRYGLPSVLSVATLAALAPGLLAAPPAENLATVAAAPMVWLAAGGLTLGLGAFLAPRRPRPLVVRAGL